MSTQISDLKLTYFQASLMDTGAKVSRQEVLQYLQNLASIVQGMSQSVADAYWTKKCLTQLLSGTDYIGRRLPAHAAKVAERLGWKSVPPVEVHVSSRVKYMADAQMVSVFKTLLSREVALSVVSTCRKDGKLDWCLIRQHPTGKFIPSSTLKSVNRQVNTWAKRHPNASIPDSITALQSAPRMPRTIPLAATDEQYATRTYTKSTYILTLLVPMVANPTKADWKKLQLVFKIPEHVSRLHPNLTKMSLPTIKVPESGTPTFHVAFETIVPDVSPQTASKALGVDFNLSTFGVGVLVAETDNGLQTDLNRYDYTGYGLLEKSARLQKQTEYLTAKLQQLEKLVGSPKCPAAQKTVLEAKSTLLTEERTRLGQKRRNIHREVSFDYARFYTDLARESQAGIIAVEDLTTLTEDLNKGTVLNNALAQSILRQAGQALLHTAAKSGISVVSVPAQNSSKLCFTCNEAYLRPRGYSSAECTTCQYDRDRDTPAAVNIAKRALLGKSRVVKNKVKVVSHQPVLVARDKLGPTPKRRKIKHEKHRKFLRSVKPSFTNRPRGKMCSTRVDPVQHPTKMLVANTLPEAETAASYTLMPGLGARSVRSTRKK